MADFIELSACQLVEGYQTGEFSPVEVTEAALKRIDEYNEDVNAFVFVGEYTKERYHEAARLAAKASEARWKSKTQKGLIDGVPLTVKDVFITKDWPTRKGSKATSDELNSEDAPPVQRLYEHGAVLLGKTTTPEFAYKGVTDSLLTGITHNPWNLDRTSGGSSGGAAVAAALGFGTLHLSSDGGGSTRLPGAFTGGVGFKSTFGRVANYPSGHTGSLAHPGINTRSVEDVALMMNVIAHPDPRDWYALPDDGTDYLAQLDRQGNGDQPLAGLKIAYSPTFGEYKVDPEVASKVKAAVKVLAGLGATVEEINASEKNLALKKALEIYDTFWQVGAAKLVRSFTKLEQILALEQMLQLTALAGERIPIADYLKAGDEREALGRGFELLHKEYDLLVTPTVPIPAFEAGSMYPNHSPYYKPATNWTPFTYPFNLTGQPAISVPCGFTESEHLPVGLQIVGAKYSDLLVLQAARAYEKAAPFTMPIPYWK